MRLDDSKLFATRRWAERTGMTLAKDIDAYQA